MEVQPPWASELLARNRKVARNICWSTSLDSSSGINDSRRDVVIFATRTHSYDVTTANTSGSISSSGANTRGKGTMVKRGIATYSMGNNSRDGEKVVDPVGVSSSSTYNRTEKPAPVLEEIAAVAASDLDMKGTSGEESILEYGPGIVRKLRSRYQSLALRQSLGRPTLRRSASLENCLDSVSSEPLSSESPSPVPYYEDDVDGDHGKTTTHHWRTETNTVLIYNNVNNVVANGNGLGINRGRSGYNDYSRKDRMRRARSVDALHRPKRHIEEKEILDKLTVVLPKEEIVIIEVSKPHSNISNGNNFNIGIDDKPQSHLYPRSLHIHTAAAATTNGYSGNSSELSRVRSVTSPEHELPPPDIVRETARIFEKHHDVPNNSTSPVNNLLISNTKKVGHALRLSKSSSLSPNSSPLPSPTTASHTNNFTTSSTTANTAVMNGQGANSYLSQNKGHLSDQGLNTSATILNNQKVKTQESNQRNSTATNGATYNSKSAPNSNNYSNQHCKQVGVIRPTVTASVAGTGLTSNASAVKGIKVSSDKRSMKTVSIAPEDSIIPSNSSIHSQQTKKPPLGPKPLFTSSPKPTTNTSMVNNNKTGSANLTDSPTPNGTNAKSPTEESLKSTFESESRMKSPTESFSSGKVISTGNISNKQTFPVMPKASIEIPKAKENDVMEFQQITLKHVTKPTDRAEIILTNGTNNSNNSSSNDIPKTVESTKTESRKDENSNAKLSNNNNNGPSNQKTQPTTANSVKSANSGSSNRSSVSPVPKVKDTPKPKLDQQQSLLRAHQKQKLDKQKSSGGETMVFNFTSRKNVPDYIEDDGLHKVKLTLGGTVTDESQDDDSELNIEQVDSRLITFEGANVIINGRSSIQKKPKSQKLNISFNEEAPTTFEYPSEASILGEDDADSKDSLLGHKTPNITNGSGLGSYTPSQLGNSYQLGNYTDRVVVTKKPLEKKQDNSSSELIEDYLKPDTGSTTWSNEIGAADILF